MIFDLQAFYRFCSQLKIETKEHGLQRLAKPLGTQRYVMEEVVKGLEEDIHFFVILKGRQLGITTISLALDLYWHFVNSGLQGTLTTDTEENRDMFRSTLSMYMEGLPKEYRIPLVAHNRTQLSSRTEADSFIKSLDFVRKDRSDAAKRLLIYMEPKQVLGAMRKVLRRFSRH